MAKKDGFSVVRGVGAQMPGGERVPQKSVATDLECADAIKAWVDLSDEPEA
jgi:hypothetical protein